jgi:hypothetical protein
MHRVWLNIVQLSFPYYVVSAGVTSTTNLVSHHFGWQAALVVFAVMYGIDRSYWLCFALLLGVLRLGFTLGVGAVRGPRLSKGIRKSL